VPFALLSLILNRPAAAQAVTKHPYIDPDNVKSETCLGCHVEIVAQVQKPVQHAAADVRSSGCFDPKSLLPYALLGSRHRRISGPALGDIRACWPKHRKMSRYLRTHFIGGRQ